MTTATAEPTTAAPAAPAAAPAPTAASPAPTTAAPAPAALFQFGGAPAPSTAASGTEAPAAAPAGAPVAAPDWLPEKYRVTGADGSLDLVASSQKLAEGYAHAQRRIGTGDLPPDDPSKYTFAMPEALKDVPLDPSLTDAFRAEAHKHGLTQQQYEFVMGKYFDLVPSLLDGAAKITADEARTQLQQVWKSPAEFEAQMSNAQRAISLAPADVREALAELGTNPTFARFAAWVGGQMREDAPPRSSGTLQSSGSASELMASEAYRNPKHPEHARVSEQVRELFRRQHGEAPAT